jgi:hypothetical protein
MWKERWNLVSLYFRGSSSQDASIPSTKLSLMIKYSMNRKREEQVERFMQFNVGMLVHLQSISGNAIQEVGFLEVKAPAEGAKFGAENQEYGEKAGRGTGNHRSRSEIRRSTAQAAKAYGA